MLPLAHARQPMRPASWVHTCKTGCMGPVQDRHVRTHLASGVLERHPALKELLADIAALGCFKGPLPRGEAEGSAMLRPAAGQKVVVEAAAGAALCLALQPKSFKSVRHSNATSGAGLRRPELLLDWEAP